MRQCLTPYLTVVLLVLGSSAAMAQVPAPRSAPSAIPLDHPVPEPVDQPWPGTLTLHVDATDPVRAVFRAQEEIPLPVGLRHVTLLYPQWRPGNHSASGRMGQLSELRFAVAGKPVIWRRDPLEPFAFHLDLPAGASAVTVELTYVGAIQTTEGQVLATPNIADIQWDRLSLYPAGHYVRRIAIRPSVTLPAGWSAASALEGEKIVNTTHSFAETDYETLADSPLFAGRNVRRWDLGHEVRLNLFAEQASDLAAAPALIDAHRAVVEEALALFGARHFDHYAMLMALSDDFYGIGTEHQRSAEMASPADTYRKPEANAPELGVVPHEFVHSWNGKFRRPARLWTPDFRQPMQPDLLWVYEGQTQFWGLVLAARSGIEPKDVVLGELASYAATYSLQAGRAWRSVEDTTAEPVVDYHGTKVWPSLTRRTDYYAESALVWLEVDQILRARTQGKRGLDDFARAFFGVRDGDIGQMTYELGDVTAALDAIAPNDWKQFFASRIQRPAQPAPLAGITAAGYRLAWRETPNPYSRARAEAAGTLDLSASLGLNLDKSGKILSVRWNGPAFTAGLVSGSKVLAVDGLAYSATRVTEAITAAKGATGAPIVLLIQRGDAIAPVSLAWHEGLRWPWLEPVAPGEQPLDRLLAPRRVMNQGGKN